MLDRGDNATTETQERPGGSGARHRADTTHGGTAQGDSHREHGDRERSRATRPAVPVADANHDTAKGPDTGAVARTDAAPRRGLLARSREVVTTVRGLRATREDPAVLQFGGADFVRAAAFLSDVQTPPSKLRRLGVTVRRPDDSAVTLRLLALLPRVEVTLSDTPVGAEAWRFLGRSVAGVSLPRVAQSVLALPAELPEYLRGRPRQALRTGLNQAKRAGFTCTELLTPEERWGAIAELEAARGFSLAEDANLRGDHPRWFAARSADGDLVAVGLVLVDEQVALMRFLVAVEQDKGASAARYLLHTHLVEQAIAGGATTMIVNSPFGWPTGLHQFQRILGYRVSNVLVRRASGTAAGRAPAPA
ncbi:hypothetical protein [Kineococcus rubinsiae]|uniref:hypothetical protein n=1 Tax=Kineococcus rubinsiae TaxID=2609562 RepID=UPI00143213F3|nr:hypothetical protein [Kineococcus rubinsiae]NIZ92163.1 hypothetical protein [Kineococcus rubinsiae]